VRLKDMINHMFILNLPPGSVWRSFGLSEIVMAQVFNMSMES